MGGTLYFTDGNRRDCGQSLLQARAGSTYWASCARSGGGASEEGTRSPEARKACKREHRDEHPRAGVCVKRPGSWTVHLELT